MPLWGGQLNLAFGWGLRQGEFVGSELALESAERVVLGER